MNKRTKRLLAMMSSKPKLRKISGLPPLTYTAKEEGTLNNYRIYGNTVDGNSVGDRTGNLFDKTNFIQTNLVARADKLIVADPYTISTIIPCNPNTKYTISKIVTNRFIIWGCTDYPTTDKYCNRHIASDYDRSSLTFTTGNDDNYLLVMLFYQRQPTDPTIEDVKGSLMFNYGEALPYEPYGYKVPVTVRGINILPMSTTPISMEVDDFHCEYDGAGTITLTTDKDNAVLDNFSIPLSEEFIIPVSVEQGGDGCVQFNNSIASSVNPVTDYISVKFWYNTSFIDGWGLMPINRINSTYVSMGGKTINRLSIDIKGTGFSTNRKIVIRPAFVLNTTEQVPFEPYHAPITTPIYLPEQIRKVGDEAEYIEYGTQKMYRIGADDLDVTLPVLPTIRGTNVLSVGTKVQPSEVEVTGRIRPVPTGGGE